MKHLPLFRVEAALPRRLGQLHYLGCESYDDPRLGARLRYGDGATKADLYLYDLGLPALPTDLRSEAALELFGQACAEIQALAARGVYLDLEQRLSQYLHLPDAAVDPMFLWAAYRYRQAPGPFTLDSGPRFSHLFLRTDGGHVNKIRYTYPEAIAAGSAMPMFEFLMAWQAAAAAA